MAVILIKPVENTTLKKVKARILGVDPMVDDIFHGHIDMPTTLMPPPTFAQWSVDGKHRDGVNHLDISNADFAVVIATIKKLGLVT